MKVTVKDNYLNVRVGSPSVNAPCYQYLAPGSEIEVDGQLYKGDKYGPDDIDTWLKDLAGNYYWSGGVSGFSSIPSNILFDPKKMSWGHKYYDIPFIWKDLKTKGNGVTVAVVDTGVDKLHSDLVTNIHPLSKSFIGADTDFIDADGHGTQMTGIICASGFTKVYGIAPEAKVVVIKASQQLRGANPKTFAQALNYAANIPEIDIVSVSNGFFVDDPDLKTATQNCIRNNKIVIAAIGNGRDFIGKPHGPDDNTYPSCYDDVIAVGSFDSKGELCKFSNWNPGLSFLSPGDYSIHTTGLNNSSVNGAGTSIATAFTSGCVALLVAYAKIKSIPPLNCIQAILKTCDDTGIITGRDIQSGYGKMNLRNAIAKLK